MKTQTWQEIADDAREIGRRLAAHAFAGRVTGSEFIMALNCARGVLRRATARRHPFSKAAESSANARGFDFCYRIGAEG